MKTIREIANELGVDKQKVYRFIKQNHINEAHHEALQRSGVKYYDEAAETLIKQGFSDETASSEAHHEAHQNRINEAVFDAVIEMLQKELEIKNALNEALKDEDIAVILITENLVKICRDFIYDIKLNHAKPLIVEIPDRHGNGRASDSITKYVRDAIGIKI